MRKTIIFIDGPQGSGKSTVEKYLMNVGFPQLCYSPDEFFSLGEINTGDFNFIAYMSFMLQSHIEDYKEGVLVVVNLKRINPLFYQFLESFLFPQTNCLAIDTTDFWGKYQGSIDEQCEALLNDATAIQKVRFSDKGFPARLMVEEQSRTFTPNRRVATLLRCIDSVLVSLDTKN